jgi:hypothetical protein
VSAPELEKDDGSLRHAVDYCDLWLNENVRVDIRTPDLLHAPSKAQGRDAIVLLNTLVKRYLQEHGAPASGVTTKKAK